MGPFFRVSLIINRQHRIKYFSFFSILGDRQNKTKISYWKKPDVSIMPVSRDISILKRRLFFKKRHTYVAHCKVTSSRDFHNLFCLHRYHSFTTDIYSSNIYSYALSFRIVYSIYSITKINIVVLSLTILSSTLHSEWPDGMK